MRDRPEQAPIAFSHLHGRRDIQMFSYRGCHIGQRFFPKGFPGFREVNMPLLPHNGMLSDTGRFQFVKGPGHGHSGISQAEGDFGRR